MRFLSVDAGAARRHVRMVEFEANYTETPEGRAEQSYYAARRGPSRATRCPVAHARPRAGVHLPLVRRAPRVDGRRSMPILPGHGRHRPIRLGGRADRGASREPRGPLLTGEHRREGTDLPTVVDRGMQAPSPSSRQRDPASSCGRRSRRAWRSSSAPCRRRGRTGTGRGAALRERQPVPDAGLLDRGLQAGAPAQRDRERAHRADGARGASRPTSSSTPLTVRLHASEPRLHDRRRRTGASSPAAATRVAALHRVLDAHPRFGAQGRPARTDAACPSCGAPLKIEMAGDVRILPSESDVRRVRLGAQSRIEQDDVYEG